MSRRLARGYLLLGALAIAGYFALGGSNAQSIAYTAIGVSAAVAIAVGARVNAPGAARPWYLFALGQLLFVAGDAIFSVYETAGSEPPFPSAADALYLAGYPALIAGMALLVRQYDAGERLPALLDATVIAIGSALIAWTGVLHTYVHDDSAVLARAVSIGYPLADLVLLGAVVRFVLVPGRRSTAYRLLTLAAATLLVADLGYVAPALSGSYAGGGWIDLGWLASYVLWGTAALHPSMRELVRRDREGDRVVTARRLALLAAASLASPFALVVSHLTLDQVDIVLLAVVSAVLAALVFIRLVILLRDVQRLGAAVAASESRLRAIFEFAPTGIEVLDVDGRIQQVNPAFAEMLGFTRTELEGMSVLELTHRDDLAATTEMVAGLADGGRDSYRLEQRSVRKDGRIVWAELSAARVPASRDRPPTVIGMVQDVTDRRRVLDALSQSEARKSAILDAALDCVITIDHEGRIVEFNPAAERTFGYRKTDVIGSSLAELIVPPSRRDAHRREFAAVVAGEDHGVLGRRLERPMVRADGSEFPAELAISRVEQPGPPLFTAYLRDVTDRTIADEERQRASERFRLAVLAGHSAVYEWDTKSGSVLWTEGITSVFGYPLDDVEGSFDWWLEHVQPGDRERMAAARAALADCPEDFAFEYRFRHHDGGYRQVLDRGLVLRVGEDGPVRAIGAMTDVSERKELEEQLRQSQKLEAVGRLAGGIAHDFNNLLTAIGGHSELLLRNGDDDRTTRQRRVEEIRKAAESAGSLTRQLLAFSRKQVLQPVAVDLNRIVAGLGGMLRRLIGEDVELVTACGDELGLVLADPGQLEQVILNLVINARDAMPAGGRLTLETAGVEIGPGELSDCDPGSYVVLSVTDTGTGMDEETKALVFEPFFTTKGPGEGTGLGLATAYGIVKQSQGEILVDSQPGVGTTFRVYLPRAEASRQQAATRRLVRAVGGQETVLLVEDERIVRKLVSETLQLAGYTVLEASGPSEAMRLHEEHDGHVDLLLTDVVMPEMSGSELAKRVVATRPALKVLYMSGYTADAIGRLGIVDPETAFLQKPFTVDALSRKVRSVLDTDAVPA